MIFSLSTCISIPDPQKGLDLGLLGKVFGSVIAVVVVLSVAATAVIYYLSRPVEHAV